MELCNISNVRKYYLKTNTVKILKTSQTMLVRSLTVVRHHLRNGLTLRLIRPCSSVKTVLCTTNTDKVATDKKQPKIVRKSDFFCKDFHLLIPHTCIENRSKEAISYLVKCTDEEIMQGKPGSSCKRKRSELINDGYLEVSPNQMVKFDHPLTTLLKKVPFYVSTRL
ncbi:uncharacterized protein LOC128547475 isoform X2 [Mercenaria mercenaria]|uniref:uncharacterized protein LOC128547475 isoform X2 n=1 Tax=Mercenaria mercenaria TaxID=6596 RepID=UPI00234F7ABB|nr:uncharacterized protein LOC128547475 isoform X2 [Mercenaria mercenaria]